MTLNVKQKKLVSRMLSPFTFVPYSLMKVPMVFISGTRVRVLDLQKSVVSVPFNYVNKNPFKSMYFAVQAMAAELSSAAMAMLALEACEESVAFIVVGIKADFVKKANEKVFFECQDYLAFESAITKAKVSGGAELVSAKSTGRTKDGTEVSIFEVVWSFKVRQHSM